MTGRVADRLWDAWVSVTPDEYAACGVGDWWDRAARDGCTAGGGS
jgi:hypothetical protein